MSEKKPLATRVDEPTHSAVSALARDRGVSNSQAASEAVDAGLSRLGYGRGGSTPVRQAIGHVATGTFHVGATLLALSFLGSLSMFAAGMGVLSAGLALSLVGRYVVPRFEPALTNRLPRIEVSRYGR